jgi:hypothetical protein
MNPLSPFHLPECLRSINLLSVINRGLAGQLGPVPCKAGQRRIQRILECLRSINLLGVIREKEGELGQLGPL